MALRLRRGTDAERLTIVPLQGELIFVTDTKKIYVGDGATLGGVLVGPDDATAFDLVNDLTPSLGGDLDLNGNDIIGTGNISINGFITATGNINLGDADNDAITVGGLINSSLRPAVDDAYDLGSFNRQWRNVYASEMTVDTTLTVGDRIVKNSYGEDSTENILWDANTDTLTAARIVAQDLSGNLKGSVFLDDSSTVLVDGINGTLSNSIITFDGSRIVPNNGSTNTLTSDLGEFVINSLVNPVEFVYPILRLQGQRGTLDNPTVVQNSDVIGNITSYGYNGEEHVVASNIVFRVNDSSISTSSVEIKSDVIIGQGVEIITSSGKYLTVDPVGVTSAPVFQTGTYTDEADRDTKIPNPQAGMIILLLGRDDSTGGPTFQGYDGSGWRDLST